ncbi:bifunctional FolD domain protein [Mycobacterium xenopi 4042]|uniref:Bifunctional FolD domain protein n=1 Tax=Mycobacterium xenopi 4042 TaxID=1299334 RepID=X7ZM88_MYCXE|nr:bifunctional FolD domain protein [Mycobacterium xenopi 4042]
MPDCQAGRDQAGRQDNTRRDLHRPQAAGGGVDRSWRTPGLGTILVGDDPGHTPTSGASIPIPTRWASRRFAATCRRHQPGQA